MWLFFFYLVKVWFQNVRIGKTCEWRKKDLKVCAQWRERTARTARSGEKRLQVGRNYFDIRGREMGGKAKPTKHTAKEIAKKVSEG
jgi:hypothetical protein